MINYKFFQNVFVIFIYTLGMYDWSGCSALSTVSFFPAPHFTVEVVLCRPPNARHPTNPIPEAQRYVVLMLHFPEALSLFFPS